MEIRIINTSIQQIIKVNILNNYIFFFYLSNYLSYSKLQVTDVMNRANNLFRHETRQARRKSNSKRLNNKTKKDL